MKLFQTSIKEKDTKIILDVLMSGELGFGQNVSIFENRFNSFSNKSHNIATNSASASAYIIFDYLYEIYGPCDVFTTSLGFTSPAYAAFSFGHNIIFVDVDNELQFDIQDYKKKKRLKINDTSIVMPVLYGGVSDIPGFDNFYKTKEKTEIVVVDSAHCVTPTIMCDFIFFSFHPYKPICTSDGGMISTNDPVANQYMRNYRNFGRITLEDSYDIVQRGFKFYMNNLNATIGLTQLDSYRENLNIRIKNYIKLSDRYNLLNHDANSSYYFATTLIDDANDVIKKTGLSRHYPMLHKTQFYKNGQSLPNLESLHNKILNLPLYCEF
jgi:perosamine synthetase